MPWFNIPFLNVMGGSLTKPGEAAPIVKIDNKVKEITKGFSDWFMIGAIGLVLLIIAD